MPEYLKSIEYRRQTDELPSAFQYAYNVKEDGFTWLCHHPDVAARFDGLMEGFRQLNPYWYNWFPVQERILDTCSLAPDQPLMVDIGGRVGQVLIDFKKRFPDIVGRLILEDLPVVIDGIRESPDLKAAGIEAIGSDFLRDVQPVKGKV